MRFKSTIKRMQADQDVQGLLAYAAQSTSSEKAYRATKAIAALGPYVIPCIVTALADPLKRPHAHSALCHFGTDALEGVMPLLMDGGAEAETLTAALGVIDSWLDTNDCRTWTILEEIATKSPHAGARTKASERIGDLADLHPNTVPKGYDLRALRPAPPTPLKRPTKKTAEEKRSRARLARQAALGDGVRGVPLGSGELALIDETDWDDLVSQYEWEAWQPKPLGTVYAVARKRMDGTEVRLCVRCGTVITRSPRTGRWSKYCEACKGFSSTKLNASRRYYGYLAYRNVLVKYDALLMHRLILGARPGLVVHHYNGDGLDNRRRNLVELGPSEHAELHEAEWRGEERTRKGQLTPIGVERHGYQPRARVTDSGSGGKGGVGDHVISLLILAVILTVPGLLLMIVAVIVVAIIQSC